MEPVRVVDPTPLTITASRGKLNGCESASTASRRCRTPWVTITLGPEAEIHGHCVEALHLSGWVQRGVQGLRGGVLAPVRAAPGRWREGGCHAAPHQPRRPGGARSNRSSAGHIWGNTTLPGHCPAWGSALFISRPDPQRVQRLAQGRRHHHRGGHPRVQQDAAAVVPSVAHGQRFLRLFESGAGSDVTFVVEEERMHAHRSILLARSPVLSSLCDDADADIEISEVSPAVFKEVLRFTYCDEVSSPDVLSTLDGARACSRPPTASGSPGSSSWPRSSSRRATSPWRAPPTCCSWPTRTAARSSRRARPSCSCRRRPR